eukprot:1161175-Pelagomonas_calceolata.AAC.4
MHVRRQVAALVQQLLRCLASQMRPCLLSCTQCMSSNTTHRTCANEWLRWCSTPRILLRKPVSPKPQIWASTNEAWCNVNRPASMRSCAQHSIKQGATTTCEHQKAVQDQRGSKHLDARSKACILVHRRLAIGNKLVFVLCHAHAVQNRLALMLCRAHAPGCSLALVLCHTHAMRNRLALMLCHAHTMGNKLDFMSCCAHASGNRLALVLCHAHAMLNRLALMLCRAHAMRNKLDLIL